MILGGEFSEKLTHVVAATAICCFTATVTVTPAIGVIGVVEAVLGGAALTHMFFRRWSQRPEAILRRCAHAVDSASDSWIEEEFRELPDAAAKREAAIAAVRQVLPLIVPTADELVAARLTEARVAAYYLDRAAAARPFDFADVRSNDPDDMARRSLARRLFTAIVANSYAVIARQPEFAAEILRHALAELLEGQEEIKGGVDRANEGIDDLKRMVREVLARTSAAPAPLAEKAASEVVAAAETAAAAGDSRLEDALALLAVGDATSAAALFEAVADERARRIERDTREAAAAYRNLGAIAGMADPARALAAYRKALAFDPDDKDVLLWVAFLGIDRGELGEAERCLREVLATATSDVDGWYALWARFGRGDIRWHRGNLAAARSEYDAALLLAEGLAKSDPDNAGWQRDLSVSYNKVGDVLVAQGNLPEALRSFRDGLAIAERLAKSDPDNAGWQRDVAVSHAKLATAYGATEDIESARDELATGRAIMAELVAKFPDWAQWRGDLEWFDRLLESTTRPG